MLLERFQDVDKEEFRRRLNTLPRADLDPEIMTLADKFREEGREQGLEQGLEQGRDGAFHMLVDLLEVRFGVVPLGLVELLGGIRDVVRFKELHRRAIRCGSLEEFAALL